MIPAPKSHVHLSPHSRRESSSALGHAADHKPSPPRASPAAQAAPSRRITPGGHHLLHFRGPRDPSPARGSPAPRTPFSDSPPNQNRRTRRQGAAGAAGDARPRRDPQKETDPMPTLDPDFPSIIFTDDAWILNSDPPVTQVRPARQSRRRVRRHRRRPLVVDRRSRGLPLRDPKSARSSDRSSPPSKASTTSTPSCTPPALTTPTRRSPPTCAPSSRSAVAP